MKILIISPGYVPVTVAQGGAIEKLIESYLDYNEDHEDEIEVFSVQTSSTKYDNKKYNNTKFKIINKTTISFKIKRIFFGILNKIFKSYIPNAYIREVVKTVLKEKKENYYDRIIFENGQNFIPYFKKKTQTNSKVILHLHNDYFNAKTPNKKEIISYCDEAWAVSEFIKKQIEDAGMPASKVKVLYNGIDLSSFKTKMTEKEKKELRAKYNINNEFVFIYTGRLMPEKGVRELIMAFNELNKEEKDIKLLIVGGTKSLKEKDKYKLELTKLAENNPNIIFTGYINRNEINKYYKIANLQVAPSICNEAFGLILLEGIACGLPIIATSSGGMTEILGSTGIYVSRENIVSELTKKMQEQLNKKISNETLENYSQILNRFSLKNFCTTFFDLLK